MPRKEALYYMSMNSSFISEIASHFLLRGDVVKYYVSETGHINDTFIVTCQNQKKITRYILQRVNQYVFRQPKQVISNICNVTSYISDNMRDQGIDPRNKVMQLIPSTDGKFYYIDPDGGFWRASYYIENCTTYSTGITPEMFYKAGKAFGDFQMQLSDFPADRLHETIPNFHNTRSRFADFKEALLRDSEGRAKKIRKDIQFVTEREHLCGYIYDRLESGEFRMRVTHNDTKMDNILMDADTGDALCVIDLDTVMPGSVLNDFGDAIRFGASSAAEDEVDLSKVYMRLDMFEQFTKGFIEGLDGSLTEEEIRAFPMGAIILTFETGMRFLTDYLNGDVYFRISRDRHNLERARNQFKLVQDMESKLPQMNAIVEKYVKSTN